MRLVLAVLFLSASLANAQALLEYAVAASGGASAGVAAKGVNAGLEKIFDQVGKVTAKAVEKGNLATVKPVLGAKPRIAGPAVAPPMDNAAPSPQSVVRTGAARRRPAAGAVADEAATVIAPVPAAPAPVFTPLPESSREALEKITAGMTRKDVIASAGEPASRILMDEDGRLIEVYTYIAKGESLGSIRLTDGTVERVRLR